MQTDSWLNIRIIGSGTEGRESNQFAQPRGVCYDCVTREIMITDCNNHRIQVFQYDTLAFLRQIGKGIQGVGPGHVNYAVGMSIDNSKSKQGRVYVADTNNHRIAVFNRHTGDFVRNIGSQQGSTPGLFSSPYGVCLDNSTGNIFVADYDNHRVQVLDSDGVFLRMIGDGKGSNPGQLNQPIVVCIDEDDGILYVADYSNNRVQLFRKDTGEFLSVITGPNSSQSQDAINGPRGICIAANYLFISDRENHRIQIYEKSKLEFIRYLGSASPGSSPGQFNRPMELCANIEDGSLIVVDGYNHRVQIIEIPELQPQKLAAKKKLKIRKRAELLGFRIGVASKTALLYTKSAKNPLSHQILRVSDQIKIVNNQLGSLYDLEYRFDDPLVDSFRSSNLLSTELDHSTKSAEISEEDERAVLKVQADSILQCMRLTASLRGSKPFDFIALIVALDHLVRRNWTPDDIDDEVIKILVDILEQITNMKAEDVSKIYPATVSFLIVVVKSNNAKALEVFQMLEAMMLRKLSGPISLDDIDQTWNGLSFVISALISVLNPFTFSVSATLSLLPQKEYMVSYSEIFRFIYGDYLKFSSTLGMKSTDSFISDDFRSILSSMSSEGVGSSRNRENFSSMIRKLLEIIEVIMRMESTTNRSNDIHSNNCHSSEGEKLHYKMSLLQKSIDYFHFSCLSFGDGTSTNNPKNFFRGNRHIWQPNEPFQRGDLLDCMDKEKSWFESYVTDILPDGGIEVHFMGWGSKWDDVVFSNEINSRIAPLNTKTKNWRAELFEGGLIEIKCNEDNVNQKWMWGKILALNVEEEWVDVAYTFGSEATINKRAYLYGEKICPIGMHTKDKSKVAAANVVKPAKKVEELIKSKVNSNNSTDISFLDSEDDLNESNTSLEDESSQVKTHNNEIDSLTMSDILSNKGLEHLASRIFESIMKVLIDSIEAMMYINDIKTSKSEKNDSNVTVKIEVIRELISILVSSPFKQLTARFIIRPYISRCGHRSSIVLEFYFPQSLDINCLDNTILLDRFKILIEKIEDLKDKCSQTFRSCFEDLLDVSLIDKLMRKIESTIFRCSISEVIERITKLDNFDSLLPSFLRYVLRDYLRNGTSPASSKTSNRRIIQYILKIGNYEQLKIIQEVWIECIKLEVIEFAKVFHVLGDDVEKKGNALLDLLVDFLQKSRNISKFEFNKSGLYYFSAELGFRKAFPHLPFDVIFTLSRSLANRISETLDLRTSSTLSLDQRLRKLALYEDFYKVLSGDGLLIEFSKVYSELLAQRLVHRNFTSVDLEVAAAKTFSCFGDNCTDVVFSLLKDYQQSDEVNEPFRSSVIKKYYDLSDEDFCELPNGIEMIIEKDFSVCTLSASIWSRKCNGSLRYHDVNLPSKMKVIKEEYEIFYANAYPKRHLHWCFGFGTVIVQINYKKSSNSSILFECDDVQAVILSRVFKNSTEVITLLSLSQETGLSIDDLKNALSTLTTTTLPVLKVIDSTGSIYDQLITVNEELDYGTYQTSSANRQNNYDVTFKNINKATHDDACMLDWIACLVDARIVRLLKSQLSKSHSENDQVKSPFVTLSYIVSVLVEDFKRKNLLLSQTELANLVKARCRVLVSSNIIDCFALSRPHDDVNDMITIPNENNYLYSYITTANSSPGHLSPIDQDSITQQDSNMLIASPSNLGNDIFRTFVDLKLKYFPSSEKKRSYSYCAATNESKDNDQVCELSLSSSNSSSRDRLNWNDEVLIDFDETAGDRAKDAISKEQFVGSVLPYIISSECCFDVEFPQKMQYVPNRLSATFEEYCVHIEKDLEILLSRTIDSLVLSSFRQTFALYCQSTLSHSRSPQRVLTLNHQLSKVLEKSSILLEQSQFSNYSEDAVQTFYQLLPDNSKMIIFKMYKSIVLPSSDVTDTTWCKENVMIGINQLKSMRNRLPAEIINKLLCTFYNAVDSNTYTSNNLSHAYRQDAIYDVEKPTDEECKESLKCSESRNRQEARCSLRKFIIILLWQSHNKRNTPISISSSSISISSGYEIDSRTTSPSNMFDGTVTFGKLTPPSQFSSMNAPNKVDKKKRRTKNAYGISSIYGNGEFSIGIASSAGDKSNSTLMYRRRYSFDNSSPDNSNCNADLYGNTIRNCGHDTKECQLEPRKVDSIYEVSPLCQHKYSKFKFIESFKKVSHRHSDEANSLHTSDISIHNENKSMKTLLLQFDSYLNGISDGISETRDTFIEAINVSTLRKICDGYLSYLFENSNREDAHRISEVDEIISSIDWIIGWSKEHTLTKLFELLFSFLDRNGDGLLTAEDFLIGASTHAKMAVPDANLSSSIRDIRSNLVSVENSPTSQSSTKSRVAMRNLFNGVIDTFRNTSNIQMESNILYVSLLRGLLRIDEMIANTLDIDIGILLQLLPYSHWDITNLADKLSDLESASWQHARNPTKYLIEQLTLFQTNGCTFITKCGKCSTTELQCASTGCGRHWFCLPCWKIKFDEILFSNNQCQEMISCVCGGIVKEASGQGSTFSYCNHPVPISLVEHVLGVDGKLQYIERLIISIKNKFDVFLREGAGQFLLSSTISQVDCTYGIECDIDLQSNALCNSCGQIEHFPISCNLHNQFKAQCNMTNEKGFKLVKTNNISISHNKYTEYSTYHSVCLEAIGYYEDLLSLSLSPLHNLSEDIILSVNNGPKAEEVNSIIQRQIFQWKIVLKSYSLLMNAVILKKYVKLQSEPITVILEILEERSKVCYSQLKTAWINPTIEAYRDSSTLLAVGGLFKVLKVCFNEFNALCERGYDDFNYRLSDNLFGRRLDNDGRLKNLLDDVFLGELLQLDISLPLSFLSKNSVIADLNQASNMFEALYRMKCETSNSSNTSFQYAANFGSRDLERDRLDTSTAFTKKSSNFSFHGSTHFRNLDVQTKISNSNHSVYIPTINEMDMSYLYIMQQRMNLIGKSLAFMCSSPFNLSNQRTDRNLLRVLKYLLAVLYLYGRLPSSLVFSSYVPRGPSNSPRRSSISSATDRCMDCMLDAGIYKSILSFMNRFKGVSNDVVFYCNIVLLSSASYIQGFTIMLASIEGFWRIFYDENDFSRVREYHQRRSSPSAKITNARTMDGQDRYHYLRLILHLAGDLHQASEVTNTFAIKNDSIFTSNVQLRWNVVFDLYDYLINSLTTMIRADEDSSNITHYIVVNSGLDEYWQLMDCLIYAQVILPSSFINLVSNKWLTKDEEFYEVTELFLQKQYRLLHAVINEGIIYKDINQTLVFRQTLSVITANILRCFDLLSSRDRAIILSSRSSSSLLNSAVYLTSSFLKTFTCDIFVMDNLSKSRRTKKTFSIPVLLCLLYFSPNIDIVDDNRLPEIIPLWNVLEGYCESAVRIIIKLGNEGQLRSTLIGEDFSITIRSALIIISLVVKHIYPKIRKFKDKMNMYDETDIWDRWQEFFNGITFHSADKILLSIVDSYRTINARHDLKNYLEDCSFESIWYSISNHFLNDVDLETLSQVL